MIRVVACAVRHGMPAVPCGRFQRVLGWFCPPLSGFVPMVEVTHPEKEERWCGARVLLLFLDQWQSTVVRPADSSFFFLTQIYQGVGLDVFKQALKY